MDGLERPNLPVPTIAARSVILMVRSKTLRHHCRQLFVLFTALWLATLGGCSTPEPAPKQVGIVLFGDSRKPQVDGFLDGLRQLGYDLGRDVKISEHNAGNDRSRLGTMVDELIAADVDLLVAAGGLEADAMRKPATARNVPVVVLYVNTITERKLVDDRRHPGWPVTGIDNLNAELSEKRVGLIADLLPAAKRILILYYENIAPSRLGVEYAQRAADKLGLEIDARAVASRDDIERVMNALQPGDVDAMLTVPTAPIDNALKDFILPNTQRLKLPLMTHSRSLAQAGALASYGADFYDMGLQAARLADKILRGVKAENIPFETPKRFAYTLNANTLEQLELTVPEVARAQVNEFIRQGSQ